MAGASDERSPRPAPAGPTTADFRHLADSIPQLAWIADGAGSIFWYNRRWYDYTGTTLDEMQGRGWSKVHHPDHVLHVVERYNEAFSRGETWEDTFPLRRSDGTFRWFLSRAEPVRDQDGAILRWFGTNTDVTDSRDAEAAVRRSEERFRTLISASADLIWTAGPDGGLIPPLPTWRAYTGQTEADYAGWGWLDIVHPDDKLRVTELWREALHSRVLFHAEFRLRRRDGEWRYSEARAAPVMSTDGTVREWVGVNSDITTRRQAEDAMQEAKELAETANRAKSQFIANMSHELRTPLSAVIGYSEMLAEEIEDVGHVGLLTDVGKIESSARHLLGLINDVLDLSKIEAGRMTVEAVDFDVAGMVDEVVNATGSLVAKKDNRLRLDLGGGLGRMHSDELKIRQCLMNLVSNAAKFTEGGEIVLRVRRDSADVLTFDVEDSGIGMTDEQMGRLFQRFSQADESTTRQFGGTGLGLAITRAFARKLGGDVSVESQPGRGSTFRLQLAARVRSDDGGGDTVAILPEPVPQGAEPAEPAGRILVVDDDPAARDLLARFLKREGFAVTGAADGQAGLTLARALRPQAILLDVEMPKMDGWSVLHALRQDPALVDTPVVMVSVKNEQSLAYALGATDYLLKPVDWDRLKRVMDRVHPHKEGVVLVIDDDEGARERMRFALSRDGWTVVEAENGQRALERLDGVTPSLILLDLMMPVMDGFDFLKRLRQRADGGLVPVVVLTAKDVTPEERASLDGQAERIISKGSLSLPDLAHELRELIPAAGR
ncbi:PAS domain-containing sensor histidine kinase [Lichenibacterium minor]|uniref:histidine kinase n=1 Tax=Lichenibacterium minor TaxID=2316528 RepID=A0A4Q2UB57_9HYPH|nr:PAS domain-containing hybrid sensor histidine kinase/response regulator [Lichenibacterium minor]RYC32387.1 PAS domain-containing sensor histidine kinase [Lichenibacterium minor]